MSVIDRHRLIRSPPTGFDHPATAHRDAGARSPRSPAAGSRSAPARLASCSCPLLTPVLFALVIAPALGSIGPTIPGLDYMSFAAVGTAGLLIPLNCMFAGIGVILDRETGARRDLLAAPIAPPADRASPTSPWPW